MGCGVWGVGKGRTTLQTFKITHSLLTLREDRDSVKRIWGVGIGIIDKSLIISGTKRGRNL